MADEIQRCPWCGCQNHSTPSIADEQHNYCDLAWEAGARAQRKKAWRLSMELYADSERVAWMLSVPIATPEDSDGE